MTELSILNKNHLSFWLRRMRNGRELIAPVRDASGDIVLSELVQMHDTALDGPALLPSPKEFLLPQMERMFTYSGDAADSTLDTRERILFGIRPCDLSAIGILDRFYLGDRPDPYYAARRSRTTVIAIACNHPDPTCFCLSLGTGPFLKSGFDIQLTDLGDRFLVETGSEAGAELVSKNLHIFTPAQPVDREDLFEARLASQSSFDKHVNLEQVRRAIVAGSVSDDFWESVALRCFECGGCVYNCPVCTCFTVLDRSAAAGTVARLRLWDTCMFMGFSRMAGGFVPAERKIRRTKRWFHHKLVHWPAQYGTFGCVGCGRCAVSCPGKIDMATVSLRIKGSDLVAEKE